jgi:hypothetical protein
MFHKPGDSVRVFDGLIDPRDESKFTIDVELNDQRMTLDGALTDGKTISLTPREGLLADFATGLYWMPPGVQVPEKWEPSYWVDVTRSRPAHTAGPSPRGILWVFTPSGGRTIDLDHSPRLRRGATRPTTAAASR